MSHGKLLKAGIAEPVQLRAEADKLRELMAHVDEIAMPNIAALLRERAAICDNLATDLEEMIERRNGLAAARHASSSRRLSSS